VPRDISKSTPNPKLKFADPGGQEDLPIEILIGSDHYWKFVRDSPPLRLTPSVVLLPSNLGWILSGNLPGISTSLTAVNFLRLEEPGQRPERDIKMYLDPEAIGIIAQQDKEWDTKDSNILRIFHDSYKTDGNRRVVSLPKKENITLPDNR
jgi:hypothetical protein